jgi:hypothetical protein
VTLDRTKEQINQIPEQQVGQIGLIAAETVMVERGTLPFKDFLRYVRVQDPPPGIGVAPFEMWHHLVEIAEYLTQEDRIIWLKARQIGATTILAAFALWQCYKNFSQVGLFSQTEIEAQDFLGKCLFIHEHLPPHLRLEPVKSNLEEFAFENGSRVRAFPSTKRAGRGQKFSLVVMDEADFHEYYDSAYTTLMPTVAEGGKVVIVSTANWESLDSGFKKLFRRAAKAGYRAVFYAWDVIPTRTTRWFQDRRDEATDLAMFEKEYPETVEQALAPAKALASFDIEMLDYIRDHEVRPPPWPDGDTSVWVRRRPGVRYMAGSDVAAGVGRDYSVTVVMERDTGLVVADVMSNMLEPEPFAELSVKLLGEYGNPIWGIEDNDRGDTVITAVERSDFPVLSIFRGETLRGTKMRGWHTGPTTRWALWDGLKAAIRAGQIHIPSEAGLKQFYECYRNPLSKGRDEALTGGNDDYPVAVAIALQMRDHVRPMLQANGKIAVMQSAY